MPGQEDFSWSYKLEKNGRPSAGEINKYGNIYCLSNLGGETLQLQIVAADLLEGSSLNLSDHGRHEGTVVMALEVLGGQEITDLFTYGILCVCEIM